MKLEIESATNGFILNGLGESEEPFKSVVQEEGKIEDSNLNELRAVQRMLSDTMEYFGIYYSKHNKYNLDIVIKNQKGFEIDEE